MQARPAYPHHAYPPPQAQIPYNVAPPAAITPGPYAPTPSLLPGPFILLLLLPSIPLLLFSLGARPPDTSHLPFTTSDIFTTGAFVTVTMTIVICLGVSPEAGGAVWALIKDGANGEWDMRYWRDFQKWTGVGMGSSMKQSVNTGGVGIVAQSQTKVGWTWKYVFDERYRRWIKVKVPVQQAVDAPRTHLRPSPKGFQTLSIEHLSSLRSTFPEWYSESKPRLIPSLLIIALVLFLLILLVGGILGSAYDTESSGEKRQSSSERGSGSSSRMSTWVERELRKRKEEKGKPEITLKRIKEEGKKEMESYKKKGKEELQKFQKKREGEKEMLKRELKRRDLPLVGLEDKKKDQDKGKGKKREKDKDEKKKDEGEDGEKKESKSDKMKKLFLGDRGGQKKDSEDAKAGPGWEIADTALAQNTLARSQMNAQQMADKLKGGG
ncbi:hypothetical protein I302_103361 [Kwoniella bestiolae CBS 10118]|uniref:Uncharacterized protein n=1 Tax=Kwoniella bestiolae CBS 10118 TaxID=1296100 RepID=A0A1B9G881_9TREE|nr:hypothetical protein I302_02062 [Kwoniella bestiolae CBS 10118]OCF27222.1 hypothetical protein I302_02062 [Kwoniella bestiolae CBS 10118]